MESTERKLPRKRKKRRRRSRESTTTADLSDVEKQAAEFGLALAPETTSDVTDTHPAPEISRSESTADAPRRRRRGRGDRRRTGDKTIATGHVPPAIAGEASAGVASGKEPVVARDHRESLADEDEQEDTSDAQVDGFAHRGIPTWEEAVGVVIAANLEARSKKGAGDTSSRHRGGRGRGGRDRPGSKPRRPS